jgi:hypothetical protein
MIRRAKMALVLLAGLGTCLPNSAFAAVGTAAAPPITDVALRDGGVLVGQVVDAQGVVQANVRVSLQDTQSHEIAAVATNKEGLFAVSNVRGGVYQLVTPQGRGIYRLWAPGTAPPSAQEGALIVNGDVVRGEDGVPRSGLKFWLSNPLVIGAIVATAIAVPVALSQQHHHPASP